MHRLLLCPTHRVETNLDIARAPCPLLCLALLLPTLPMEQDMFLHFMANPADSLCTMMPTLLPASPPDQILPEFRQFWELRPRCTRTSPSDHLQPQTKDAILHKSCRYFRCSILTPILDHRTLLLRERARHFLCHFHSAAWILMQMSLEARGPSLRLERQSSV